MRGKEKATRTERKGGERGEQPSLNNSSQLRQGQKTVEELGGIQHAEIT